MRLRIDVRPVFVRLPEIFREEPTAYKRKQKQPDKVEGNSNKINRRNSKRRER